MTQLISYEECIELMKNLYQQTHDVSVFYDRGWGDSPLNISIITDGYGSRPHAYISYETYQKLLNNNIIGQNDLRTFKARRNHQYKG